MHTKIKRIQKKLIIENKDKSLKRPFNCKNSDNLNGNPRLKLCLNRFSLNYFDYFDRQITLSVNSRDLFRYFV